MLSIYHACLLNTYALSYELKFMNSCLDYYAMSLFHMFVMYVVIQGRLEVHQVTSNRENDSIVRGLYNHGAVL